MDCLTRGENFTRSANYDTLLRNALFPNYVCPVTSDMKVKGNIFRYKSGTKQKMNLFGLDDELVKCRFKRERIVPKTPYKVCDEGTNHNRELILLSTPSSGDIQPSSYGMQFVVRNILQGRAHESFVSKFNAHESEVCGLKWSCNSCQLASGENDNKLFVWNDQHSRQPVLKYHEHTVAVKAIAWSPRLYRILASGDGTGSRSIRLWNAATNSHLSRVNTDSKNTNELVSTHGYPWNKIIAWRYPSMSKLATLTGHTDRVTHLAISPDGQKIVTGTGETFIV
nr:hypothetical protein [Tanacetum cinerariifolium]